MYGANMSAVPASEVIRRQGVYLRNLSKFSMAARCQHANMFQYLIRVEARLSDPDLLRGTWWKMAAQLTYDGTTWREMLANCLGHLIGSDTKPRFYTSLLRRVVNMCIISSDEHWWKFVERLTTSWYYLGGYTAVPLVRAVHARSAWLVKLLLDNGVDLQAACGSKRRQNISSGLASTKGRCPFSGPRL